jgi:DNA-binding response OmpR family regulator
MQRKVLVVEDETKIREIVKLYLERDGFLVYEASTGLEALEVFQEMEPDLVILDLMLPELSGEEVCSVIRSKWETPIIMLTAKTSEGDRVRGLQGGADDYVTKPFSPKELVARVNAVLRRNWGREQQELISGDEVIRVNQAKHEITIQGAEVALTPTEYRLLVLFLRNPGVVFSRSELAEHAFGWDYQGYEETIYVHIKNLRKKFEVHTTKAYITTVYGMGYKWVE